MEKKLGLSALTALVLSSMLGAGVFSLPQNMAAVAGPAALLTGWLITGAGRNQARASSKGRFAADRPAVHCDREIRAGKHRAPVSGKLIALVFL